MFYEYRQNNTFGTFTINMDVNVHVIIEASSVKQANERAESVGLYFDGCADGMDCPCCGDRWYATWDQDEGDEVPSSSGKPLENIHPEWVKAKDSVVIHYDDGSRQYASEEFGSRWVQDAKED
jgi:hypothetical protein